MTSTAERIAELRTIDDVDYLKLLGSELGLVTVGLGFVKAMEVVAELEDRLEEANEVIRSLDKYMSANPCYDSSETKLRLEEALQATDLNAEWGGK